MSTKFTRQVPQYDGSKFIWNSNNRTGICDASDLGLRAGRFPWGQAYSDACDAGIEIRSPLTGMVVQFVLDKDEEHWEFTSINVTPEIKVTIYND